MLLQRVSRHTAGTLFERDESGKVVAEYELLQCPHCQFTWRMTPDMRTGPWCTRCGAVQCGRPECTPPFECQPIERQVELWERRARLLETVARNYQR